MSRTANVTVAVASSARSGNILSPPEIVSLVAGSSDGPKRILGKMAFQAFTTPNASAVSVVEERAAMSRSASRIL
jgi:hypothetical protein